MMNVGKYVSFKMYAISTFRTEELVNNLYLSQF